MNYFMTGEAPRDWKDFLAARTGKKDANGNDQRMWPVSYVNSWYSWATHPIQSGINRANFVGAETFRIVPIWIFGETISSRRERIGHDSR